MTVAQQVETILPGETATVKAPSPSPVRRVLAYIGYGLGPFGACAAIFPTGSLILYFLTDTIHLNIGLATLAIALPKLWDVLVDPAIGAFSDRHSRRVGSRFSAFALASVALPVAAASAFVFHWAPTGLTAAIVTLLLIGMSTAYTIYWVTHLAAANDLDQAGFAPRNVLLVARMIGQSAGGLLAGAVAPLLLAIHIGAVSHYALMATSLSLVGMFAMLICALTLRWAPTARGAEPAVRRRVTILTACQDAISRPAALGLILSNFTVMIACTYVGTMLPYINKYLLGFPDSRLSFLFSAVMGAQIAGATSGALIARRLGNRRGFLITSAALLTAGLFFYPACTHYGLLLAVLIGWGGATGAYTVLLHASMLDAAKDDAWAVGILGLLLGLLFATGKIGDTAGSLLSAASLASSGGIAALGHHGTASMTLSMWAGVVPGGLILAGILMTLLANKLTDKRAPA